MLSRRSFFGMSLIVVFLIFAFVTNISAEPLGGEITVGEAEISQQDNITDINQSTENAAINWQSFGINADEVVNFNQPGVNSITLNRVFGNEKSIIDGALNADGQVWLLNSNGVLFGKDAAVNTSGLLSTTKELSDEDFMTGNYNFTGESGEAIINRGAIDVGNSGYAALLGKEVINEGLIRAELGQVHLRGGRDFSLDLNGNSIVNLTVTEGELNALVENKKAIIADGGEVYLTTNAVDELLSGVVNNKGLVEAKTVDDVMGDSGDNTIKEGYIEIFAHGGTAEVGGKLTTGSGEGFIETSGREFAIQEDAEIITGNWLLDPVNVTIDATLAGVIETGLSSGDVTVNTAEDGSSTVDVSDGESGTAGDIIVDSAIRWAEATKLTLDAYRNIIVNETIDADFGQLALYYGQGTGDGMIDGKDAFYQINSSVYLPKGENFITKLGNDPELETKTWTVITDLGSEGDGDTGSNTLQGIAHIGNLNGNYVLGEDIHASATSGLYNGGEGFDPIGDDTNKFTGSFDGLGHTIYDLYIDRPSEMYVGLFGYVDSSSISNLEVRSADITGGFKYVGGLAGRIDGSSIENVSSSGFASGQSYYVGGIAGYIDSTTIKNSNSSVQVEGSIKGAGCLVGRSENSSNIISSYATGNVSGKSMVGGLVGVSDGSNISASYATGTVSGAVGENQIGGLAGRIYNNSLIEYSYATGAVSGSMEVGGLAGNINNSKVLNSYATGNVSGVEIVGGLVGKSDMGTIKNSYSIGKVEGDVSAGGLLGNDYNNSTFLNDNFWNIETSGQESSAGQGARDIEGLTTAEIQDASNFSAWNNEGIVWSFGLAEEAEGYEVSRPYLINVTAEGDIPEQNKLFAGGWGGLTEAEDGILGADGSAYKITDWHQQDNIRLLLDESGFDFALSNSLDEGTAGYAELVSTETGFEPIGDDINPFTGSFFGGGYTIDGLTINRPLEDYVGLFGYANDAEIRNIGLENVIITGKNYVGGLIGKAQENILIVNNYVTGTVENIVGSQGGGLAGEVNGDGIVTHNHFKGSVVGQDNTGGLIGRTLNNVLISRNYSDSSVEGRVNTGGLIGYIGNSNLNNNYTQSSITGQDNVGGLVGGTFNSVIEDSYTYSKVEGNNNIGGIIGFNSKVPMTNLDSTDVINSYYDKTVNPGMNDSSYGKTTVELKKSSLFKSAGWDESIWTLAEGESVEGYALAFPYLNNVTAEEDIPEQETLFAGGWGGLTEAANGITGADGSAYYIEDWNQLANIDKVAVDGYSFELQNNLDSETSGYQNNIAQTDGTLANNGTGWKPIGSYSTSFNGIFDGVGHTISDLYIAGDSSNLGLFGVVKNADIINLNIDNAEIIGSYSIGTLAGIARYNTHIENVHVDGILTGNCAVGGLVGALENSYRTILNSSSTGIVTATGDAGGLVGVINGGTVDNSYSEADVIYNEEFISIQGLALPSNFGGLVGSVNNSTIKNSYALGNLEAAEANNVGGLVGSSGASTIESSYAVNTVAGNEQVGGLIGYMTGTESNWKTLKNSYAAGTVNGNNKVGGLVGVLENETITNSYSISEVSSDGEFVEGLIGYEPEEVEVRYVAKIPETTIPVENEITASYYDKTINPGMSDEAEYGKTTEELQEITTYTGWDIAGDDTLEKGYPVLSGETTPIWLIGTKVPVVEDPEDPEDPEEPADSEDTEEYEEDPEEIIDGSNYIRDIYIAIPEQPQSGITPEDIITYITSLPGVISADEGTGGVIGNNRVIYLSELLSGQDQHNGTDGTDDVAVRVIRVRIAQDSLIELINGGVSLPAGVDQIFFITDEV